MSVLRVNKISNEAGTGPVEFSKGVTFPASQNFTETTLTLNTTGIVTATTLIASDMDVVGIMTGTFIGNGARITNVPGIPIGKVIGQHLIT